MVTNQMTPEQAQELARQVADRILLDQPAEIDIPELANVLTQAYERGLETAALLSEEMDRDALGMPCLSGYGVAQRIRSLQSTKPGSGEGNQTVEDRVKALGNFSTTLDVNVIMADKLANRKGGEGKE